MKKKKIVFILSALFVGTAVASSVLTAYSCNKKTTTTEVDHEETEKQEESHDTHEDTREETHEESHEEKQEESHEKEKQEESEEHESSEETEKEEEKKEEDIPTEEGCKHSWSSFVITKAPTCVSTGLKTRSCKSCLKTQTEIIPVDENGHDYGEAIITKRATCLEEGEAIHYCNHNHDHALKEKLDKIPHIFSDRIEEVAPTFRKEGKKAHYHCVICDTDFATDMETVLNDEDMIIPKLDSTNIDKLENRISTLDAYSSNFKEYHGDVIESIYNEYNSLSKEERNFIETEKYKNTNYSYKQKLDKLKETYNSKFPFVKKIYDSKDNSIAMLVNSNSGAIIKSTTVNEEYGYVNKFNINNGSFSQLDFLIKPTNIYTDYIKKGGNIYIYSPIDSTVEFSNTSSNDVIAKYQVSKGIYNLINIDSSTMDKLCNGSKDSYIDIRFNNLTLNSTGEFKISSIYSNYYTPSELLTELNGVPLTSAFSKSIIESNLTFINSCSSEFKSNSSTISIINTLNDSLSYVNNKYSLYMNPDDLKYYSSFNCKYVKSTSYVDSEFGNSYLTEVSKYADRLLLMTTLNHKSYNELNGRYIEFYVKGDFSNFSKLTVVTEETYDTLNTNVTFVTPNIIKVVIDKDDVYNYICKYQTNDLTTNIYIYDLKPGQYVVSPLYFSTNK